MVVNIEETRLKQVHKFKYLHASDPGCAGQGGWRTDGENTEILIKSMNVEPNI